MTVRHQRTPKKPQYGKEPRALGPSTGELRRAVLKAFESIDDMLSERELKRRASQLSHAPVGSDEAIEEIIGGFVSSGILEHVADNSRKLKATRAGQSLIKTAS